MGENRPMAGSAAGAMWSADEARAAEALLARAWGDSLLAGGRERVQAELIAYAEALGSMHA
jgi:hypothetical protein